MKTRDVVLISLLSLGAAAALFAVAAYLYIRRKRRKREDDEDGTSCAIRYIHLYHLPYSYSSVVREPSVKTLPSPLSV